MALSSNAVLDGSSPGAALAVPRRISAYPLPGDASALGMQALELANVLQSTLEVERIIQIFGDSVAELVPHDNLEYQNAAERTQVILGRRQPYSCTYQLVLMEKPLGEVSLSRRTRLTHVELERLERLLCALVYPLRNAILYKRALDTAYKDPVTGINNRAALNDGLGREVDLARRHGIALSLIMLDIDRFKWVNDAYGHVAGDAVLKGVADCIVDCIRASDMVFRFGGEEFAIVLSSTELGGACLLANRIRESLERQTFWSDGVHVRVTASLGVAALEPGEEARSLVARADEALYCAKTAGRNRVAEHHAAPKT